MLPAILLAVGAILAPLASLPAPLDGASAPAAGPAAEHEAVAFSPATCAADGDGYACEATFEETAPTLGEARIVATLAFPGVREYLVTADSTSTTPPDLAILGSGRAVRVASQEAQAEANGRDATQSLRHVARSPAGELSLELRFPDRTIPDLRAGALRVRVSPAPGAPAEPQEFLTGDARRATVAAAFDVLAPGAVTVSGQATGAPTLPLDALAVELVDALGAVVATGAPAADGAFQIAGDALAGLGSWSVALTRTGPSGNAATTLGLEGTAALAALPGPPTSFPAGAESAVVTDAAGDAPRVGDLVRAWFGAIDEEGLAVGARLAAPPADLALAWSFTIEGQRFEVAGGFAADGSALEFALARPDGGALPLAARAESASVSVWIPKAALGVEPGAEVKGFAASTRDASGLALDETSEAPPRAWDAPAEAPPRPTTSPAPTPLPTFEATPVVRKSLTPVDVALKIGYFASAALAGLVALVFGVLGLRRIG